MPAPVFAAELVTLHRNPWIFGGVAFVFLGGAALFFSNLVGRELAAIWVPYWVGAFALIFRYFWQSNFRPVTRQVAVHADGAGITIGARFIPRRQIRAGFILPLVVPTVLLRRRYRPSVRLLATNVEEGRALLRSLGLDVTQTVAAFPVLSPLYGWAGYGITVCWLSTCVSGAVAGRLDSAVPLVVSLVLWGVSLLAMAFALLVRGRLTVGADGLVLRWLGGRRYYRYDEIAAIHRQVRGWVGTRRVGLKLSLRSGKQVFLSVLRGRQTTEGDLPLIEERIREAALGCPWGNAVTDAGILRRGDRSVAEWVAALRSIGSGANVDMRTAPFPREQLFRMVEDPTQPEVQRAAAAVALGVEVSDADRVRLRAVVEATAAPKLRIAIETAGAGADDAEIAAALAEVEAQDVRRRARSS